MEGSKANENSFTADVGLTRSEPQRPLPTFIIAGSARSGTTYLYNLLDHHPEIYLAKPRAPEPKFFLVDEEYVKGLSYYSERFFAPGAGIAVRGEKRCQLSRLFRCSIPNFQESSGNKIDFCIARSSRTSILQFSLVNAQRP
jgi:Sulfotransferase family